MIVSILTPFHGIGITIIIIILLLLLLIVIAIAIASVVVVVVVVVNININVIIRKATGFRAKGVVSRSKVLYHVRSATALQAAAMAAGGLLFGGLGTPRTGGCEIQ